MEFPRLLYKGAPDETAQTCQVAGPAELNEALAKGWRLRRRDDDEEKDPEVDNTLPTPRPGRPARPEPRADTKG